MKQNCFVPACAAWSWNLSLPWMHECVRCSQTRINILPSPTHHCTVHSALATHIVVVFIVSCAFFDNNYVRKTFFRSSGTCTSQFIKCLQLWNQPTAFAADIKTKWRRHKKFCSSSCLAFCSRKLHLHTLTNDQWESNCNCMWLFCTIMRLAVPVIP